MPRPTVLIATLIVAPLASAPAHAIEAQQSAEIAASPEEVWAVVGEFCSIADWHPMIESCILEEEAETTFRVLNTTEGQILRDQLLDHDHEARFYRYAIVESPLPVDGYVGALSVAPAEDQDRAFVVWQSEFTSREVADADAEALIRGIYEAGLEGLQQHFE